MFLQTQQFSLIYKCTCLLNGTLLLLQGKHLYIQSRELINTVKIQIDRGSERSWLELDFLETENHALLPYHYKIILDLLVYTELYTLLISTSVVI